MKIESECVVSIQFKLTGDDGAVLDASEAEEPLVYLHGSNNLIPGLENVLTGKSEGDQLEVTIQPEDGYGSNDPELVQTVPVSAFGEIEDIQPGMQFQAQNSEGQDQIITIQEIDGDEVVVDGNHPLAGQRLHFDVTVESVRKATLEEISHGHAHA